MNPFTFLLLSLLAALTAGCALNRPPALPADVTDRATARRALTDLSGGEFFTCQGRDGAALGAFRHRPAGRPHAVVVLLHGFQTHAGWMAPVARRLAADGIEVWCPDRRGSGVNAAGHFPAGDLSRWQMWVEDLDALMEKAAGEHPDIPLVLAGYSWGAVIAAAFLETPGEKAPVSHAIMIAPGWASQKPGAAGTTALLGASLLLPGKRIYVPTPKNVAATPLGRSVLWEDPAATRQVTLRYLRKMHAMQQHTNHRLSGIRVPVSVLLAGADELIDNPQVETLAARLGAQLTKMETLRCASHLLVMENAREVADFIHRRIPARTSR